MARQLASLGARVVATDLSPAMCTAVIRGEPSLPCFAADMTTLPVAPESLSGVVCFFAVIHLDAAARAATYREFARVLTPGAHPLIGFHTSDPDHAASIESRLPTPTATAGWGSACPPAGT